MPYFSVNVQSIDGQTGLVSQISSLDTNRQLIVYVQQFMPYFLFTPEHRRTDRRCQPNELVRQKQPWTVFVQLFVPYFSVNVQSIGGQTGLVRQISYLDRNRHELSLSSSSCHFFYSRQSIDGQTGLVSQISLLDTNRQLIDYVQQFMSYFSVHAKSHRQTGLVSQISSLDRNRH